MTGHRRWRYDGEWLRALFGRPGPWIAAALLAIAPALADADTLQSSRPSGEDADPSPRDLCDGMDPCPEGEPCDTGLSGQCAEGVLVLEAGPGSLFCQQIQGPTAETCDGVDNNCDGFVDDNDVCGCGGVDGCECNGLGDCDTGFFCRWPLETCEGPGTCTPIPVAGCPPDDTPVCSCDGATYPNECEASLAGVSIESERACRVQCESCEPPGSSAGINDNECTTECTVCGDGVPDPGEQCDDGNTADTDDCRNNCLLPACGDLIPDPFESCDPPGSSAGASGNLCRPNCTVCGDGLSDLGEECDDGNANLADACANDCSATASGASEQLRVDRDASGGLLLTWGPSCVSTDDDYGVYAGMLGDFASHQPVTCTTAGAAMATVLPLPGDEYFLVVPSNANREGSYGTDSAGSERVPSTAACAEQRVAGCP